MLVLAACGADDGNEPVDPDVDAATLDGGDGVDAPDVVAEPCDPTDPALVSVDEPIEASPPGAKCESGLHFYRFTPPETGVYTITKTGGATVAFCTPDAFDGCICGGNINCCAECTLTFDLPDGSPLPAGTNQVLYISKSQNPDDYHFEINGPE